MQMETKIDTVIQGDCIDVLKTLPDETIDCCVTSPPYYGLRDYGTGEWVGGDPNCPHRRLSKYSEKTITGHAQDGLAGNVGDAIYKSICPLCGAVRHDKQIGLEETPEEYIEKLVNVFREVKRVMKDDGTLWVNIGDSYAQQRGGTTANGMKHKDLIGIPWMLAFALRTDGWYLRQDIIWHKPNPMPESVKDRCTKSHEYIFLLSKKPKYYFDYEAIQEDAKWAIDKRAQGDRIAYEGKRSGEEASSGKAQQSFVSFQKKQDSNGNEYIVRNKRDVWTVPTAPIKDTHFATFPEHLIEPCILAGSRVGGGRA